MERKEAFIKLRQLIGQDLHELAEKYEVTVRTPSGSVNKSANF